MLVLTRKKDQSIIVDGAAEIYVISIRGGTVKLGIKAADEVKVDRREVRDAKIRDAKAAEVVS